METLEFKKITRSVEDNPFECGVASINEYVKNSYYQLLIQHAYTFSIMREKTVVGYYQVIFRDIELDKFPEDISDYSSSDIKGNKITAVHIRYIAIDKQYQKRNIGTAVLKVIIKKCLKLSEEWPIRVITIDALNNLVDWYSKAGFKKMQRNTGGQDNVTTAMYFDCMIHSKELEEYNDDCCFLNWGGEKNGQSTDRDA